MASNEGSAMEPQWLTSEERQAWLAIASVMVRLPAALDTQLQAESELSFFEYMVLAILAEQDGRSMTMSEVADFVGGSLSRLSHAATRLEKRGLLTRASSPGRGRSMAATLTDAGLACIQGAAPGHVAHVRRLLIDSLDPADLQALVRIGDVLDQTLGA